eukprot:9228758-Ditylum_brightwellii.AAC.1
MGTDQEQGPLDEVVGTTGDETLNHMLRCKKCAAVRRVLCFAQSEEEVKRPDKREKLGAGGGLDSAGAGR